MGIAVLQLQRITAELVDFNEPLVFDNVDFTNNTIDYEATTGVLTFNNVGIYTFSWFISPVTVNTPVNINFVIETDGVVQLLEVSPAKHSKLHGHCSIKVVTEKTKVRLINISNNNGIPVSIQLNATLPVQANLMVIDNLGLWNTESDKLPPIHHIGEPPTPPAIEGNNVVPPIPLDPPPAPLNPLLTVNSINEPLPVDTTGTLDSVNE